MIMMVTGMRLMRTSSDGVPTLTPQDSTYEKNEIEAKKRPPRESWWGLSIRVLFSIFR